jgi:nitroimidazol reductase NimA-like FMN-containing flavoprotein (pyridoxamine 5'-phosphate oxidase superfamily)
MSLAMTREEREQFLADVHVGIISIQEDGRGPLTVPIWYMYQPGGDIVVVTGAQSRKGKLLEKAGRFSLCAQTETPPYRYVTVEGPVVSVEPVDVEKDARPLAHRYLGPELGDGYLEATAEQNADSQTYRMRPVRWLTVDYSKQFGDLGA